MKTKEAFTKKSIVVYRKDGKTPDLRFKSSKEHLEAQPTENNKEQEKEAKTVEAKTVNVRYTGLRDHVLLHQTAINKDIPVQIKPAGKKPVWKVNT